MMALVERVRAPGSDYELELAKYLWEEYRYRHDLIWRLLFRVTAVAALLSIAPFTISDTAGQKAGFLVKFLPGLATDSRNATACAAVDAYRSQVYAGGKPVAPNPDQACATSFGNTDTIAAAVTY